jgi:hypothetical protein
VGDNAQAQLQRSKAALGVIACFLQRLVVPLYPVPDRP